MSPALNAAALVSRLRDDLGFRRIRDGIRLLEERRGHIESLTPSHPHGGTLVGLVAQWVDAGFDSPDLLARLLARFPAAARSAMPLVDYLHLRMAEGALEMATENLENAVVHFRCVQQFEAEAGDAELVAIAYFWAGRCLRKMGCYDEALSSNLRGEELALSCGYHPMAAITQVTQSWLAFQKGRLEEAVAILRRAEASLRETDDYLNRGNILSAHGRIARRQGRYETAIECFENALAEYRNGGGGQTQMARTLQNLAFVKRLRALQLQKQLDLLAAARRSSGSAAGASAALRAQIEKTRSEAAALLEESIAIYDAVKSHRGIAGALIICGFLRLDAGDLESAAAEAAEAFHHGEEKHDHFVMARARTLQCIVEHAAFEEQVGDAVHHRGAAVAFAREAVAFAGHTQNRRLLARAYVWQGLIFASGPEPDAEAARRCCEQAASLLQPDGTTQQYAWDEFEALKAAVLQSAPIEPRLRAWSAGILPEVSFQQLTEEFARVVIPKVWEREDRKIARVAAKLSISPKKVRRILQSVGALK